MTSPVVREAVVGQRPEEAAEEPDQQGEQGDRRPQPARVRGRAGRPARGGGGVGEVPADGAVVTARPPRLWGMGDSGPGRPAVRGPVAPAAPGRAAATPAAPGPRRRVRRRRASRGVQPEIGCVGSSASRVASSERGSGCAGAVVRCSWSLTGPLSPAVHLVERVSHGTGLARGLTARRTGGAAGVVAARRWAPGRVRCGAPAQLRVDVGARHGPEVAGGGASLDLRGTGGTEREHARSRRRRRHRRRSSRARGARGRAAVGSASPGAARRRRRSSEPLSPSGATPRSNDRLGQPGLDPALALDQVAARVAGVDVLPGPLLLGGGQLAVEQRADARSRGGRSRGDPARPRRAGGRAGVPRAGPSTGARCASAARSMARPRWMRERTVPSLASRISAISS